MPSDEAVKAAEYIMKDVIKGFEIINEDISEDQLEDLNIRLEVQLEEMAKDSEFIDSLASDVETSWIVNESIWIMFTADEEGNFGISYIGPDIGDDADSKDFGYPYGCLIDVPPAPVEWRV